MKKHMKHVEPAEFLAAYNLANDESLAGDLLHCRPRHRALARIDDPQEWLDAYARIIHETTQRHADDFLIYTTDAIALLRVLDSFDDGDEPTVLLIDKVLDSTDLADLSERLPTSDEIAAETTA